MTDRTISTIENLIELDEDAWIEVVNGELVETDMSAAGYMHTLVIENPYNMLRPFVYGNKLGRVHIDGLT